MRCPAWGSALSIQTSSATDHSQKRSLSRLTGKFTRVSAEDSSREARVEGRSLVELVDLFRGELDAERLDVRFELVDRSSTEDREGVGHCLSSPSKGDCGSVQRI